jgi:hypothetical protein
MWIEAHLEKLSAFFSLRPYVLIIIKCMLSYRSTCRLWHASCALPSASASAERPCSEPKSFCVSFALRYTSRFFFLRTLLWLITFDRVQSPCEMVMLVPKTCVNLGFIRIMSRLFIYICSTPENSINLFMSVALCPMLSILFSGLFGRNLSLYLCGGNSLETIVG